MLQTKKYITPPTRFATIITVHDQTPIKFMKTKKKANLIKHKKIFYISKRINAHHSMRLNWAAIVENYSYNRKPYQMFLICKGLFNQQLILPGIEGLIPGQILRNYSKNISFLRQNYLGSQVFVKDLPFFLYVTHISNNFNNKSSYAKASGTFGTKLKPKKTIKLTVIELPSNKEYFFLNNTPAFVGKNTNFFNHKFIEGKWGWSLYTTKKLTVRGVAKNPVDHPNGGRTKAKQPEKSPWGWIAKHNK